MKSLNGYLSRTRAAAWIALIAFGLAAMSAALAVEEQKSPKDGDGGAVRVQMNNLMYHYSDGVAVHIRKLAGALVPTKAGEIPVFDNKQSFRLEITAAEIAMDPQALATVLNGNVFNTNDAPLKDLSIRIDKDRLKINGKLRKKGNIPFETEGRLSATPDGKIRLHAEKIRALHLPVKGAMDLFGVDMADMIKSGKVRGVQAEKDDLILDPAEILPPPHIAGHVTSVRLESGSIVQVFGDPQKQTWERVAAQNYMAYHGNRLQFGKLTMHDTDMLLIDPDPRDPFDFYLDRYKDQLVAGQTKITPAFGLRVFMVDYNKLKSQKPKAGGARKSK